MYFGDSERKTLLLKGENSPFRKILSLLKLIFGKIYFNMVQEKRRPKSLVINKFVLFL